MAGSHWRINFILGLIFLFAAAIIGRLVFLQIIKYDFYSALARGQQGLFIGNNAERGEIFFKIATSKMSPLVYLYPRKIRSYPYGSFASHILGFVNNDGEGQYGVEGYWNKILEDKERDLRLTVDYNIQYQAEKLLNGAVRSLNAEGGTIIVMEPGSGSILALADSPNFDPNNFSQEKNLGIFQADAFQKIFEPGSAFKPITMAAALDKGKITPQTTFSDPGVIKIGKWEIYNYDQRTYQGDISMTEVLEKSINTGAVFAQRQLGDEDFLAYIEKFGIFEKTGIDLQGEASSPNNELKRGYEINFATASFGQGIEMTPLQLARAFSVIANGGELIQPHLAERAENDNNKKEVISPAAASKLTAMLVSVVENGFGKAARIPGYYIAGKTGTAQVSFSSLGIAKSGYSDKTWQSFIGFAPAFNPQFLILVKLNNPQTKTAEYSAVPIFRDLAKYIIDYRQIPPDYDTDK
jgi:stage V sporulation protein D (sporulation-specific penicillin-binding protein)